jgi:sporulation protein YlmC with PRC-barrel domain
MARDHDRLKEDQAGIGPDPGNIGRLHRLSESNHYRIASGEPDIRGWEVRTLSGNHLGEVEDLLIDPHRGEVVMLDVDLNNSPDRVNLPIRGVQLDRSSRCVIVDTGDIRNAQESLEHRTVHERGQDEDDRLKDVRASDRDVREEYVTDRELPSREIHYRGLSSDNADETVEEEVVERRPIVEEVVVRRRVVDDEDLGSR